ncbi:MAG: RcpC/CpaB family pilus assembly protein [Acidimicrobiales bacterium]|nr:RcpC/CpaB family pilus assembly protein [Acidimicrobiales bacterium]
MALATKKRSTFLIGIGACALIVSTALATLATRGGDDTPKVTAAASTPTSAVAPGVVANPAGVPSFTIPTGKQAIAVQVASVPAMAGYVKAGDDVNVYSALTPINGAPAENAGKLILQKVEVLASQAAADGMTVTYVLSVDTNAAEAIVYLTNFQKVYLTLARDDQGSLIPKGFNSKNA